MGRCRDGVGAGASLEWRSGRGCLIECTVPLRTRTLSGSGLLCKLLLLLAQLQSGKELSDDGEGRGMEWGGSGFRKPDK